MSIRLERTYDLDLVKRIQTAPSVYRAAADDLAPSQAEIRPSADPRIWYVLAYDGSELLGMLEYRATSPVCWEVHCCLLPASWGKAAAIAELSFRWIFALTVCRRIVASIPACNRLAVQMAKRAGMQTFGFNPNSWLKHGHLYGQFLYGISKEF